MKKVKKASSIFFRKRLKRPPESTREKKNVNNFYIKIF
jgi:hypothetical protein